MTSCLEQLGKSDAARYFGNRTVLLSELDIQLNILRGNVDEQLMLKVALLQADLHRYWEAAGWIHVLSSISVVPDSVQTQARKWRQLALQDPSQNYGFQQEVLALDLGTLRPPLWNDVEAESLTKTPAGRSADQSAQVWKDLAHESGLRFLYFEGTKEENRLQHIFNVVGGGVGAKVSIAIQLDAPASPVIQVVNRVLASPTGILVGLTLINLPSVLVFWRFELGFVDLESTFFAVLLSPLTHALWHTVLAIDEWWRAKNGRLRIVFLVNHILWVLLLLRA